MQTKGPLEEEFWSFCNTKYKIKSVLVGEMGHWIDYLLYICRNL